MDTFARYILSVQIPLFCHSSSSASILSPSFPIPFSKTLIPSMKPSTTTTQPSSSLPIPTLSLSSATPKCFSSAGGGDSFNSELAAGDSGPSSLIVVSFYKFADFPDHADFQMPLKQLCEELRVSGGIILAPEGINGSICGTRESVERVLAFIQSDSRLKGLRQIESPVTPEDEEIHHGHTSSSPVGAGEDAPFRWDHVRVKLKKEIVSLGMPSVSPSERVGTYVSPKGWNSLISDPNTVSGPVVVAAAMYELVRVGHDNLIGEIIRLE